jgi:hypothetical protein
VVRQTDIDEINPRQRKIGASHDDVQHVAAVMSLHQDVVDRAVHSEYLIELKSVRIGLPFEPNVHCSRRQQAERVR